MQMNRKYFLTSHRSIGAWCFLSTISLVALCFADESKRISVDLDGDGKMDSLVDDGDAGKMGRTWKVLLNRGGKLKEIGSIVAHPKAISFEPDYYRIATDPQKRFYARVWVYLRSGGGKGAFGYYRIGEDRIEDLRSIEIYPGDGGTTMGNAIYEATFKESPIPFQISS